MTGPPTNSASSLSPTRPTTGGVPVSLTVFIRLGTGTVFIRLGTGWFCMGFFRLKAGLFWPLRLSLSGIMKK